MLRLKNFLRGNPVTPQTLTGAYLFSLLTFFLFYCGPTGYSHIVEAKFTAFAGLCGGYLAAMAGLGLWSLRKREHPLKALFRQALKESGWAQRLGMAFLLVTWLSALCSPYWPETALGVSRYEGACTVTLYVLTFLLVSAYARPGRWMLWVSGGALCVLGIICILQMAGGNPLGLYPGGYRYADAYISYSGAYLGTLGNVDLVGAFYSLMIPVFVLALLRMTGRKRFLLTVPLGISLYVLVRMDVLAGLVGAGMGILLALPVAGFRTKRLRLGAGLALAGLLLMGLCGVYLVDWGEGLFHEVHQVLHGNFDASFGTGRLYIWKNVWERLPERLLLGQGPDTMLRAGMEFRNYSELKGRIVVSAIDMAHNEYLNVLYHQGLLGFLAYGGMLLAAAWQWIKTAPESPAAAILGAGVLGYGIQALFGFSMCITAAFFWAGLGLLVAAQKAGRNSSRI